MKQNIKEIFKKQKKKKNDEYLRKLVRIRNNKEEHSPYDRDDLDYYGIRDIENLFDEASEEDHYYKPIFVKSSHKGNYNYYESNEDKENDLINDHKIVRRVWKIQINMHFNFISSRDTGETRIYYVWSDNLSIMQGEDANTIIREIFRHFLHNYQQKLKMIKGSDFVFESVDLNFIEYV